MTPLAWFKWARRIVFAILLVVVVLVGYVWIHIWWSLERTSIRDPTRSLCSVRASTTAPHRRSSPARLAHAVTLYDEGVAPHVVTVGGKQPGDNFTEAQSGRMYLRHHGVPRSAIVAVQTGSDTLGSLRAVAQQFRVEGWHSAVIVTDPWHCLRSRTMARDLGIRADTSPERTGPAVGSRVTEIHYIARETEAYIYYQLFHNDDEHSAGVL